MEKLMRFIRDDEGVTSIEYALLASLIAIAIILALSFVGDQTSDTYEKIANEVSGAGS